MAFWDDMKIEPCPSRFTCPLVESNVCNYSCYQYHSIKSLLVQARIPNRYQGPMELHVDDTDREAFKTLQDFKINVNEHVEAGHGLYLYSPMKGNGKTSWAIKILTAYLETIVLDVDINECKAVYVNVPQYMKRLKDNISVYDNDLHILREHIEQSDLVIWDDIGREKPSQYSREVLYSHINNRYEDNKSQIFTSNRTLVELANPKELGHESVDRMVGQCRPIEFKGRGRRQETAWWNTK